jgi:uncharacterized protein YcbX
MHLGTLDAIWRYPAKSLAGESLAQSDVLPDGIPGDRSSELVVRSGHARMGKAYRGKEHNLLHLTHSIDEAIQRAAERGVVIDAVADDAHYFDDAPISLLVDRWLAELSAHMGFAVEPERYRPNFIVRGAAGMNLDEGALTGRELQLGEVALRVRYPIERCVTTTYDLRTGESTSEILRYVAQERSNWMGVYCDVLRAGTVRIGDSLELVER